VKILVDRFPPSSDRIRTTSATHHQPARGVKQVAGEVDAMIVVGAPNSSNSQRLCEVAVRAGCPFAVLVQRASDIDWARFAGVKRLGVTAGASAPKLWSTGSSTPSPSASTCASRW